MECYIELMKKLLYLPLILSFLATSVFAAEADHYTERYSALEDASELINAKANSMLQQGINKVNKKTSCNSSKASEKELYSVLRTYFGNHSKGELSKYLLKTKDVPKRTLKLKDSIYGEWSILNGYLLGKKSAANSPLALAPMVYIGNQLIGIDKLEHMFGMGYIYFKNHHIKGKSLKTVLKRGIILEKTTLGGNVIATGVFAYADLAANFNGMRFWNHMLQKREDVLGEKYNAGPYVSCNQGKWQVTEKKIDFKNYVDKSMDESINCSKFATKNGLRKFKGSLKRLNKEIVNSEHACPMVAQDLVDLRMKYNIIIDSDRKKRPISHWIINEEGSGKVSYFNEF
jgi:hypothetical protein